MTDSEYQETLKAIGVKDAETNKSPARIEIENEQYLLDNGEKAVDLSLIPQDQHHLYDQREVAVPKDVEELLLNGRFPLSEAEIHMIEEKMDRLHNVAAPNRISMCIWVQQTGKPRCKLPRLASEGIVTGFQYLHKIE
jgi:hypothetical protein